MTAEEWVAFKERSEETGRLLLERIAYHRRKLIEENPGWTPPKTSEEWIAYHQERLAKGTQA